MIYIQFREAAGDVVQQHIVVSDNAELVRGKSLFVVVQDIGDPVHGHSGLAASGHALYHQKIVLHVSYDDILIPLNRLYNRLHLGGGILSQ